MFSVALFALFISLAGMFFLTAVNCSLRRLLKKEFKRQTAIGGSSFFYRPLHLYFFPKHENEGLLFATICAQNVLRFCYAVSVMILLASIPFFQVVWEPTHPGVLWLWIILTLLGFISLGFIIGDYIPRILGGRYPEASMRTCSPFASFYLVAIFPLIFFFLKLAQLMPSVMALETITEPIRKEEIIDMLQSDELNAVFDVHDKELLESVVTFKERIAREVMIPRVDIFSLPAEMTIKEAALQTVAEGYSRIPIHRNTVDNIVGVLMYKDVLSKYVEYLKSGNDISILEAPISSIQKSVLHIPETKKISSLLQEFRKKQVHLAIIVDEYGGTAGIVTIEDILEEIVGEISDEYDVEEELYYRQSDGSWVVDARMNILDVEEDLDIAIPQEGEYDTIGGYIFHITGMIPSKGFVIHQNQFDMEILKSNDRCVERVRIRPLMKSKNSIHEPS